MKIIKIFKQVLFLAFLFFASVSISFAQGKKTELYIFWSKACPHCASEKVFLEKLADKYSDLSIKDYEIGASQENFDLFAEYRQKLEIKEPWVPLTVVADQYIIGYQGDSTTGSQIEQMVEEALGNGVGIANSPFPEEVAIPFFGKIKIKTLSLPVLSVVLGFLDGFNPCAMWALVFLISLLLGMKNRLRMWIFGSSFIVVSALVYFLIMAAWLNAFLFLGFISWIRFLIGLVALWAGWYNFKEFITNKDGVCKVTGSKKRQKFFKKLRKITQKKEFFLALGGIVFLAFAVNMVELICSAGLPAIFTQVLVFNDLPAYKHYFYLLVYIFFFMLDDLVVFFVAMTTLKMIGFESKYTRFSHLIGGILMVLIGLLMLFKPEWLMFA